MMASMTASEFRRWAILEQIQPFGEYGEWMRSGLLTSLIANVHRKNGTFPFSPEDFMPETMRTKKKKGGGKMEPKHIFAMMMLVKEHQDAYLARMKKKEKRKRKSGEGVTDGNNSRA